MKRLGLVSAFLIALSACGKSSPDLPPAAEFPAAGEAAKTIIRSTGTNARALRYAAKAGEKSTAHMEIDLSIDGQGVDVGFKIQLGAGITIDEVDDKGTFKQSMVIDSAMMQLGGELAKMGADTSTITDTIKGTKMSFKMDNQGRLLEADLGEFDNPMMGQMQVGMDQALQGGVVPFPTEPVGVGAQWDALTTIDMNGAKTRMMASYKLLELDGDKGTLEFTLKGGAASQKMTIAGAGEVDLNSLDLEASGRIGFDLAHPAAGSVAMKMKMSMDLSAQGENATMKMGMAITMTTK